MDRPELKSKWRAKIGKHIGLEVEVVKVGDISVALKPLNGTRVRPNGSSRRGALMRLPLEAFYRRYEPI